MPSPRRTHRPRAAEERPARCTHRPPCSWTRSQRDRCLPEKHSSTALGQQREETNTDFSLSVQRRFSLLCLALKLNWNISQRGKKILFIMCHTSFTIFIEDSTQGRNSKASEYYLPEARDLVCDASAV